MNIERRLLNVPVQTFYFVRGKSPQVKNAEIVGYLHSFVPRSDLRRYETSQIDILQTADELLAAVNSSTRRQIRRSMERNLDFTALDNPSNEDIKLFQTFYNRFARNKKTDICNGYHVETLQLLREKRALVITYLQDEEGSFLCYRVYATDGTLATNLYSASHYRLYDDQASRKTLGMANRLLIWKSILYFKQQGCSVYDTGGLTDDENIRKFKLSFGGSIVPVYSGYEARTLYGKCILLARELKLKLTRGIL